MTSGEKLKIDLRLKKFKKSSVRIARFINFSQVHYIICYDSKYTNVPLTTNRIKQSPFIVMLYKGEEIKNNSSGVVLTPFLDLEEFNGTVNGSLFLVVDLAGQQLQNKSVFENNNNCKSFVNESRFIQLYEEVYLKDFQNFGLSPFGMKFRKEKNQIMGAENKTAKLISVELQDKNLLIHFLTEATDKYPDGYQYKQVNQNTLQLEPNPSKLYEIDIAIVDFLDWLDTYPDKSIITEKDIKDIFEVSPIKLWSNLPSMQFQGGNFFLSVLDGSLHPTNIAPKHWNSPDLHGDSNTFLDKALYGILQQFSFWKNPLASMVTKYLKGKGLLK